MAATNRRATRGRGGGATGLRAGVRRLRERHRRAVEGGPQAGFSLVELVVAMSIFAVILGIFAVTIVNFSNATTRTVATSDQTSTARTVYDLLDKQVRQADAIGRPALVGTNWYVEYRDSTVNPAICTQWVVRTATGTLAMRQWTTGVSTPVVGAWQALATDDTNPAAGQAPFSFTPATTASPFQQLTVYLSFQAGGPAKATVITSTFTAVNSSTSTSTNPDPTSSSYAAVCQDIANARPAS